MKTTPTRLVSRFAEGSNSRRVCFALLLVALAWLGLVRPAAGQGLVPERFSFQGYMEDGNGQSLGSTTPTNYATVFRIFPVPTGGAAIWAERQTVTFDKGNYSVTLGQGSQNGSEPYGDLSAVVITTAGNELYLQTTVNINGSDATILPRLRLLPSTYAFLARKALSVDGVAITAGTITEDRLSSTLASTLNNGPIADARLTPGLRNYITNGPIADTRLSSTILAAMTNGPVADDRLSPGLRNYITNGTIADTRLSSTVARRNAANSFVGDQTITGNSTVSGNATVGGDATVNGDLKLGASAQYSVAVALAKTQIVSGRLPSLFNNPDLSATASGLGWTAARQQSPNDNRFWKVTFNPVFTGPPAVIAGWAMERTVSLTGDSSPPMVAVNGGTSFIVTGNTYAEGGLALDTHFIAIGPR